MFGATADSKAGRQPAQLLYLVLFNPTLRPDPTFKPDSKDYDDDDDIEQASILFYTSKSRAVSRDTMLRQVGLAKALINFSELFTPEAGCDNVHSQKKRMIMYSPEPNFWMHACIQLPTAPKVLPKSSTSSSSSKHNRVKSKDKGKAKEVPQPSSPAENLDYVDNIVHDSVLRLLLQRAYESFRLQHGTFSEIIGVNGGDQKQRQRLEGHLEQFFNVWAWNVNWDLGTDIGAGSSSSSRVENQTRDTKDIKKASAAGIVDLRWHLGIPLHPRYQKLKHIVNDLREDLDSLETQTGPSTSTTTPSSTSSPHTSNVILLHHDPPSLLVAPTDGALSSSADELGSADSHSTAGFYDALVRHLISIPPPPNTSSYPLSHSGNDESSSTLTRKMKLSDSTATIVAPTPRNPIPAALTNGSKFLHGKTHSLPLNGLPLPPTHTAPTPLATNTPPPFSSPSNPTSQPTSSQSLPTSNAGTPPPLLGLGVGLADQLAVPFTTLASGTNNYILKPTLDVMNPKKWGALNPSGWGEYMSLSIGRKGGSVIRPPVAAATAAVDDVEKKADDARAPGQSEVQETNGKPRDEQLMNGQDGQDNPANDTPVVPPPKAVEDQPQITNIEVSGDTSVVPNSPQTIAQGEPSEYQPESSQQVLTTVLTDDFKALNDLSSSPPPAHPPSPPPPPLDDSSTATIDQESLAEAIRSPSSPPGSVRRTEYFPPLPPSPAPAPELVELRVRAPIVDEDAEVQGTEPRNILYVQNYGLTFALVLDPSLTDVERGKILARYTDSITGMPLEDRVDQTLRLVRDALFNPSMTDLLRPVSSAPSRSIIADLNHGTTRLGYPGSGLDYVGDTNAHLLGAQDTLRRFSWITEILSRSNSNSWFAARLSPSPSVASKAPAGRESSRDRTSTSAGGMLTLLEAGNDQASLVDVDGELGTLVRSVGATLL